MSKKSNLPTLPERFSWILIHTILDIYWEAVRMLTKKTLSVRKVRSPNLSPISLTLKLPGVGGHMALHKKRKLVVEYKCKLSLYFFDAYYISQNTNTS